MDNISRFMELAQRLCPENLDSFVACYAQDAVFTDPFQTVRGRDQVRRVYLEMLQHLHRAQFRNVRILGGAGMAKAPTSEMSGEIMVGWDFEFSLRPSKPRTVIAGCSLLRLNDRGEIMEHRDYWDASRLMEAFPGIGQVIGWLRKKIGQPSRS